MYISTDAADSIDSCRYKLAFITDCLSQAGERLVLSPNGETGLFFILQNIEDDLKSVSDEIISGGKNV